MRKKSGTRARVSAEQQELQIGPTELGNKTQNEFDYPKQKEGKSVCVCVCGCQVLLCADIDSGWCDGGGGGGQQCPKSPLFPAAGHLSLAITSHQGFPFA